MPKDNIITEKMREAIASVLPITLIVALLCLFLVPVGTGLMLSFLIGSVMIVVGMGLFTLGSDLSMTQIGNHIGARMTRSRKLGVILGLSFLLGVIITVAEPDLQVLANNVPEIDTRVLIITVSAGVGLFLMISMLRILFRIPLKWLLVVFYAGVFTLAALSEPSFLSVAFDSGGVTTGPMTVPFIMALGVGVASIRSDENAKSDSFGLVALCSIGPILSVLILGFVYDSGAAAASETAVQEYTHTVEVGMDYIAKLPTYLAEVALALAPIFAFFLLFQIFALKIKKRPFQRILAGIALTYVGLVLFLTGVNVGFSPLGQVLGGALAEGWMKYDGLVHHQCRACRPCPQQAGRGAERGRDLGARHGSEPFDRRCSGKRSCHAARADGAADPVFYGAGLSGGAGAGVLRAADVHGHCL